MRCACAPGARLIGAAALLLTAAIVVPMLLDPEPKPTSDNIAIDIPSEKTPFTPRLTLPPVPAPDNVPVAPPQESAPIQEKVEDSTKAAEAKKVEEQRARALLEGKSKTAAARNWRQDGAVCRAGGRPGKRNRGTRSCRAAEKVGTRPIYGKGGYQAGCALSRAAWARMRRAMRPTACARA